MAMRTLLIPLAILGVLLAGHSPLPSAPQEAKSPSTAQLNKARLEAARRACMALAQEFVEGKASVEQVHQWSRRWLNAQRDAAGRKSAIAEAFENHVDRMRQLEKAAEVRYEAR